MTDTTPLITGVDFVCIPAQDFDAMTAFYGETLGLPFVKRYGSRPGAEYQAGNLTLAIMRTEDFGGTFSRNAMPIALQVADVAVADLLASTPEVEAQLSVEEEIERRTASEHSDAPHFRKDAE